MTLLIISSVSLCPDENPPNPFFKNRFGKPRGALGPDAQSTRSFVDLGYASLTTNCAL